MHTIPAALEVSRALELVIPLFSAVYLAHFTLRTLWYVLSHAGKRLLGMCSSPLLLPPP